MSKIDTNLPISQLSPLGAGAMQGTRNPSDAYVGPSMTPSRTSAYQSRKYHTRNLPDAFVDRALRIRNSTEQVAWNFQQRYQTTKILPLKIVQDLVLQIRHTEAWPTFFAITPEQAVSHMLTRSHQMHTVRLVRWSLQDRLEHGFMQTPEGQEDYDTMLNQFATSMNETAIAEVNRALLEATDPQQTWLQRHGQLPYSELENYLRWDLFCFAALQKNPNNPLGVINARVEAMMLAHGGQADSIIMSQDLQIYAQMVPAHANEYWLGGPQAVANKEGRPGPGADLNNPTIFNHIKPVNFIGKNAIYVHRSMVVENSGEADPWRRTRQIGEWNILEDTVRDHRSYTSDRRTIFVYNQDTDSMSPITLRAALMNDPIFERNGQLRNLASEGTDPRYSTAAQFYPFAVPSNSYSPIKFCGDLSQQHFGLDDVKKLAVTMANAAYRSAPGLRAVQGQAVVEALDRANRRLRGDADPGQKFRVLYSQIGDDAKNAFESFAGRLRSIVPGSIFLNPDNSVFADAEGGSSTPGRTLYETLVYSNAYPVFQGDVGNPEEDMALRVLVRSLSTTLENNAAGQQAQAFINNLSGSAETQVQQLSEYLLRNPEATKYTKAELNAFVTNQVQQYRQSKVAVGDATGTRLAGFALPGSDLSGTNLSFGALPGAGTFSVAAPPAQRTVIAGSGGTVDPFAEEFSGSGAPPPQQQQQQQQGGDKSFPTLRDNAQIHAAYPSNAMGIHMFQRAVGNYGASAIGARVRRASPAASLVGGRFGSATEQIGASVLEDERFLEQRFRERGNVSAARSRLGMANLSDIQLRAALGTMSRNLADLAATGMDGFLKLLAVVYYGIPFNRDNLVSLCDNDIVVPVTYLFVRPHITVESRIMVKVLSGGGAGYTYYAHADVAVGDNVMTGTHTINMHFYLRSHVHAPRNVFIIPDVFIIGYQGGMGVTPITDPSQYTPNDMAPHAPCAFFFMCSYKTTRETVPNPFNIGGYVHSRYRLRGAPVDQGPAYDSAVFYAPFFGLGANSGGDVVDLPQLYEMHRNTLVYRGHQEEDDNRGGYTRIEPNTGHWGIKVYKGCKAVREGENYRLRDVAYGTGLVGAQ